jgi:hypothetical protein
VFCQLDSLRQCLPARIRKALDELPESLDGTYGRILQGIHKQNRQFAHRIFQCVAITSRPLRVEELAEFLAFDFDTGPIPMYRPDWRPEDPLFAVLSTCSSLLAVVEVEDSEVMQFSHFSVKEFLTSTRLAEVEERIPLFHVVTTHAHTLVVQACLGILLHLDESITSDDLKNYPFVEYAAEHWVDHARVQDVSASTQDEMRRLFDPRKPYLAIWVWIFNPDVVWRQPRRSAFPSQLRGSSLHYAALLGLCEVFSFLVIECSQDVNAPGLRYNWTPLHAASKGGRVEFARILLEHGSKADSQDDEESTPLHLATEGGHIELTRMLVEHGENVDAQDDNK